MSEHQHKQAVRVANVPAEVFDRVVEAPHPATVTKLAEMGTPTAWASSTGPRSWSARS